MALHGVTTNSAALQTLFRAPWHRSVYACDLRGHGSSPWDPPWTLAQHVRDLLGVVEAVGGSAVLLGHSFGGLIALHTALATSEVIEALVLLDPALEVEEAQAASFAAGMKEVLTQPSLPEARLAYRTLLEPGTVEEGMAWFEENRVIEPDGSVALPFSPAAVDVAWREMTKPVPPLSALAVPLLLVIAERDSLVSPRAAERLTADLGSHAQVATVASGHDLVWADPADVRELIVDFLDP